MRIVIFILAIAVIAVRGNKLHTQFVQSGAISLQSDAIAVQSGAIAYHELEVSYFEPFDKVLNCNLIAFTDSMNALANRLQVPAVWLYRTMIAESGLNPKARNSIGAVGLIQFLPATASDLGTSAWALRRMTAIEQLRFVEKFYKPAVNQIYSYAEFRLFAFFPAALKWDLNRTLTVPGLSAKEVALRNPAHDLNRDFVITKLEYLKSVGYVSSGRD